MGKSPIVYYLIIICALVLLLQGNPYTISGFVRMSFFVIVLILTIVGLYIRRKNNEK